MIGKSSKNVVLALINAYKSDEFSHCSVSEFNAKYGISLRNLPDIFKQLEDEGYIENCTVNGYFKRFKILKPYTCPKFVLDSRLNTQQKNFLLACRDNNITGDISKKEFCRRVLHSENLSNLNRILNKIEECIGGTIFSLEEEEISGLIPEKAIYTKHGYRSGVFCKKKEEVTYEDETANFLYKKSYHGFKHRKNIIEYALTPEIIKKQLLKQDMKDYYTGVVPKSYEEYSIDRIDSSRGYVEDNIVITTGAINTMKLDMSIEEFKEQIKLLYNNMNNF